MIVPYSQNYNFNPHYMSKASTCISNSWLFPDFYRRHSVVGQIIVNLLLFKCDIFSGENSFDIIDGYNEREMDTNERIISHHRRW